MSLDTALFLVDRGGTNYQVSGADILDTVRVGDKVLVQRDKDHFHCAFDDNTEFDTIRDDDLLLAWEDDQSKHVTGYNFKKLFGTLEKAEECHRVQYEAYLRCRALCESDYCNSICLREFNSAVEFCYDKNGQLLPPNFIPPPRP